MTSTIDQGEDNDMVDLSSVDEDEDGMGDLNIADEDSMGDLCDFNIADVGNG